MATEIMITHSIVDTVTATKATIILLTAMRIMENMRDTILLPINTVMQRKGTIMIMVITITGILAAIRRKGMIIRLTRILLTKAMTTVTKIIKITVTAIQGKQKQGSLKAAIEHRTNPAMITERMTMITHNIPNTSLKGIVIPMASKAEKKKIPIVATITEPTIMIMDTSKKVMSSPGISTANTAMATKDIVMKNMITLSTKNTDMNTEGTIMDITMAAMITDMEDTITVRALCR